MLLASSYGKAWHETGTIADIAGGSSDSGARFPDRWMIRFAGPLRKSFIRADRWELGCVNVRVRKVSDTGVFTTPPVLFCESTRCLRRGAISLRQLVSQEYLEAEQSR